MKYQGDAELVPGTEILLNAGDGFGSDSSANEELLLVPKPSNEPDDPLVRKSKLARLY
jgi:hypothetical protein